ncbi:MAG: LysR family transcriptional regulator [Tissierellaceae bacterium]|nr:LysR family transcriptional regulator [Tissierellaceae bacterium]
MKAGYRVWIEDEEGNRIFGEGPYQLLELIEELGSINKASKKMNMSYSKTMRIIKKTEEKLGIKLLDREIGGIDGGGAKLTDNCKELMERYGKFRDACTAGIERIYNETF